LFGTSKSNSTFLRTITAFSMRRSISSGTQPNTSLTTDGTTTPHNITKTKNTLHHETYSDVREKLSLQSSLVQSARNLAATALGNCKDRIIDESEKASKPDFNGVVVVYNGRTITYNDDHISPATVEDRVTAEYVTPVNEDGTPFEDYRTDA